LYAVFVFCMDLFWLYGFGGGIVVVIGSAGVSISL
jgi:hypothetical protein